MAKKTMTAKEAIKEVQGQTAVLESRKRATFFSGMIMENQEGYSVDQTRPKGYLATMRDTTVDHLQKGVSLLQEKQNPGYQLVNPITGTAFTGKNQYFLGEMMKDRGHDDHRFIDLSKYREVQDRAKAEGKEGPPEILLKPDRNPREVGYMITTLKSSEIRDVVDGLGNPVLDNKGRPVTEEVKLDPPVAAYPIVFNVQDLQGPGIDRLGPTKQYFPNPKVEELAAREVILASGVALYESNSKKIEVDPSDRSVTIPSRENCESDRDYMSKAIYGIALLGSKERYLGDHETESNHAHRAELASFLIHKKHELSFVPQSDPELHKEWAAAVSEKNNVLIVANTASSITKQVSDQVLAFRQHQAMQQQPDRGQQRQNQEMEID